MTVKVKLDAYVLPDDLTIYKFFPGKNYKFHRLIRDEKVAIIDVRNLDQLGDDPSGWKSERLLKHISADRVDRNVQRGASRPTRIIRSAGDKAKLTFLEGLFFKAKKGDLIVMPQKGYTSDVLIGQFTEKAGTLRSVSASDNGVISRYFGRKITWLAKKQKRLFSDSLIDSLHSQAAFFDLGSSSYDEVQRLAFDNFIYDNQFVGTLRTEKRIFTPKDSFLVSVWLEMLEVVETAHASSSALPRGSIYDLVIASDIKDDDRDDLSINVQSPGWFRLRSAAASPLVSLAMFALALNGVPYAQAVEAQTVAHVVRSAADGCVGELDAAVRDYIRLLGSERWEQACKLAVQADAEARLKVGAVVNQKGSPVPLKKEEQGEAG